MPARQGTDHSAIPGLCGAGVGKGPQSGNPSQPLSPERFLLGAPLCPSSAALWA